MDLRACLRPDQYAREKAFRYVATRTNIVGSFESQRPKITTNGFARLAIASEALPTACAPPSTGFLRDCIGIEARTILWRT